MRRKKMLAVVAVSALVGCHVGRSGADLPVAKQPGGAQVSVRVSSGSYGGELLAVSDDGVFISSDRIVFAPFSAIMSFSADEMGRQFRLEKGEVPSIEKLARLRAVSRFPQGLTPNIRSVILGQRSQAEIAVIQ